MKYKLIKNQNGAVAGSPQTINSHRPSAHNGLVFSVLYVTLVLLSCVGLYACMEQPDNNLHYGLPSDMNSDTEDDNAKTEVDGDNPNSVVTNPDDSAVTSPSAPNRNSANPALTLGFFNPPAHAVSSTTLVLQFGVLDYGLLSRAEIELSCFTYQEIRIPGVYSDGHGSEPFPCDDGAVELSLSDQYIKEGLVVTANLKNGARDIARIGMGVRLDITPPTLNVSSTALDGLHPGNLVSITSTCTDHDRVGNVFSCKIQCSVNGSPVHECTTVTVSASSTPQYYRFVAVDEAGNTSPEQSVAIALPAAPEVPPVDPQPADPCLTNLTLDCPFTGLPACTDSSCVAWNWNPGDGLTHLLCETVVQENSYTTPSFTCNWSLTSAGTIELTVQDKTDVGVYPQYAFGTFAAGTSIYMCARYKIVSGSPLVRDGGDFRKAQFNTTDILDWFSGASNGSGTGWFDVCVSPSNTVYSGNPSKWPAPGPQPVFPTGYSWISAWFQILNGWCGAWNPNCPWQFGGGIDAKVQIGKLSIMTLSQ